MASQTAISISPVQRGELRAPSRGIFGQITTVLTQPVAFFARLPVTRQWLWAGCLILLVIGVAAIRRPVPTSDNAGAAANFPPMTQMMPGGDGGSIPFDPTTGGIPPEALAGLNTPGASEPDISDTLITGLLAAANLLVAWAIQTLLLAEVSLFNGVAPRLGRNLQIAIWASVPLGLMAALQLLYYAMGGQGGQMGVALLLERWAGYAQLPTFVQAALHSLTAQFTLFWLWSALLLYTGAREALHGKTWAAAITVAAWLLIAVLVPAVTGAVEPLAIEQPDTSTMTGEMPPGFEEFQMLPGEDGLPPERSSESSSLPLGAGRTIVVPAGGGG